MMISSRAIEQVAPDQASLKSAVKLLKPAKWPLKARSPDGALLWGECQGSGANPYRVAVDASDLGAKCSCPSRKFPCKHALALMMQFADGPADFAETPVPDWIVEWMGRRRKTTQAPGAEKPVATKSLNETKLSDTANDAAATVRDDPKSEARREAARAKRAEATREEITEGLSELEGWISDQLRTGLSGLLEDLTGRCRRIASRMVDAKAGALAGRIDGIPARILALPAKERTDAIVSELGKLVVMLRSWGNGTTAPPALRREIATTENREALLNAPDCCRVSGLWEVVACREETRRDGLIATSTWLLNLDAQGTRFALLQDFRPASAGKQGLAFDAGDQFQAELAFYPAKVPLRALIVERSAVEDSRAWPAASLDEYVLQDFAAAQMHEPWILEYPLLLPPGRIAATATTHWWSGEKTALPLSNTGLNPALGGVDMRASAVLWNGHNANLLAADTSLGRYHADG